MQLQPIEKDFMDLRDKMEAKVGLVDHFKVYFNTPELRTPPKREHSKLPTLEMLCVCITHYTRLFIRI